MGNKILLLVNLLGTLVNYDEIITPIFQENKKHKDIVHKLHLNSDFAHFIKRFDDEKDLDIVFYTGFCTPDYARNILKKADLLDDNNNDKYELVFLGNMDMDSRVDIIVREKYINGSKNVVVLDTNQGFNNICERIQHYQPDIYPKITFFSVYTRMYTNGWNSFAGFTRNKQEGELDSYFFADSVTDISNFIACLLSKPQKANFFYFNEDTKVNRIRYYLFDYYPIGEGASIIEPFSKELIKQVKGGSNKSGIVSFFCSSIAASIYSSGRDIHTCAFVIIPSHTVGSWNENLSNQVLKCLINQYGLNDTRFAIERTKTIPKQSITNLRDFWTQLSSLHFDIRKIYDAECIVLLDDVTTSGVSVDACRQIIEDSGFKGTVLSFAIGGTQTKLSCNSPSKYNVFTRQRPLGEIGYIFDLDGTLLDSSIAKEYRDNNDWERVYSLIPEMTSYVYIVAAIKELIRKGRDVAIVTSSTSRYCYNVLHFLGIETDRITTVCYHDSNKHKPDPEPYMIAYNKMSHRNETIMCIGDEENDIIACKVFSKNIGVKTIPILLNRKCSDSSQPYTSLSPNNDVLQFSSDLDFLFFSDQFYREMNAPRVLYHFALLSSPHYFSYKDFLGWLEKNDFLEMKNGSRIPTAKGEKLGIEKILVTNTKYPSNNSASGNRIKIVV